MENFHLPREPVIPLQDGTPAAGRQQSSRQYQGYEEKEPYPVCPLEKDCRWKCRDWKTDECQRKETEGADQEHQGCEEIPGIPCRGCQVQQGQEDRYLWKIHRNDYQTEKKEPPTM